MFTKMSLRLFSITLSLILALAAFFSLQPDLVNAQPPAHPEQPSTMNQAANHSTLFDQLSNIGTITGKLSFPSESIPPLTVFAIRIDNEYSTYYSIDTTANQAAYTIEVDPGIYNVYAFRDDYSAGYTRYVTCGMGAYCSDHSPLPVVVKAGNTVNNIDLSDWYAPSGTFPTRPDGKIQSPTKPVCVAYHTVSWGETLYKIGMRYNLTWKPIAQVNNLVNPNRIYAGQVLCIPNTTKSSPNTSSPSSAVPTFVITDVTRNKQVSIRTRNFPPYQEFKVTMGKMFTQGIDGIEVGKTYSGSGGSVNATYTIPKALRGLDRIAVRLESSSGYYSYNWFYNHTAY